MKPTNLRKLKRWALAGNAQAAFVIGSLYDNGWLVTGQNERESAKWFRIAVDGGFYQALLPLARAYYDSASKSPKNAKLAFGIFDKVSRTGNPDALVMAGLCLIDGIGTKRNRVRGTALIRKAAREGNLDAQTWLGVIYKRENNLRLAKYWLTKACVGGDLVAGHWLDHLNERDG